MQDQEFITDNSSENLENQESDFAAPETENFQNFSPDADLPEEETIVITHHAENPETGQAVSFVENAPADEDELFSHYEIKSWDYSPRLYKIFASSALMTILFVVGVAQTDVLRTKACDSPLVGGFCQVLDTLYVGGKVLGGDTEFGERAYEPTDIQDAEIVWVDQTGIEPPLDYPAGYFQIANPEMFQPTDPLANPDNLGFPTIVNPAPPVTDPAMPNPTTITPMPNNQGVLNRPQKLPRQNKNAVPNNLPDGITIPSTEDTDKKPNPTDTAKNDPKKDESKQPDIKSENIADFRPNKEPLKDFAKQMVELRKDKNSGFDLSRNFSVELSAVLTEEGKFDRNKTRYVKSEGEEKMVNIVKAAIEKIGDSQVFYYLKSLGVDKITFVLEQNDNEIRAVIKSNLPSEQRAKTISSGFNGLMVLANTNIKETDKELQAILKASNFKAEGKDFIINFNLDKNTAQAMIKEQLDKAEKDQSEEKQQKPNSTAQTVNPKEKTGK